MIIMQSLTRMPRMLNGLALSAAVLLTCHAAFAEISNTDWDNDGISDEVEEQLGTEMYLADTDGDGVPDKDEIGDITEPLDSDNDGVIDAKDIDDDGDGIPTIFEGRTDVDGDGRPNYLDQDSDGDNLADNFEAPLTGKDSDNDQIDDYFDIDTGNGTDDNGDGVNDKIVLVDSDKDGTPDLLDKDSTMPHIDQRNQQTAEKKPVQAQEETFDGSGDKAVAADQQAKPEAELEEKPEPLVMSAPKLPVLASATKSAAPKRSHSYIETQPEEQMTNAYGGSGYFYCANSNKIVPGIKGFMMTPPSKIKVERDAKDGHYRWSTSIADTYAMQFQVPQGMSIVRGLAKGRRIIKPGDPDPLVLGGDENPTKKGYLMSSPTGSKTWHTSFEIKDGAPAFKNNNIPLSGGICEQP